MAKVHDGTDWTPVDAAGGGTGASAPIPPAADGDGSIFIAIPSFRDGKRCAETIRSIFDNAKDPDKVVVGLIEQNDPEDDFCLSEYCDFYGVKNVKKRKIREDVTKLMVVPGREESCPRYNQIRMVAFFNIAANGPNGARALTRKILGNEEYCMQIDAHTRFVNDWDDLARTEWKNAGNEFAVLSTVPPPTREIELYESWTGEKNGQVPRQCRLFIGDNEIPEYPSPADGKATGLTAPLLSSGWSAAFSFSKCHIEETAPYDPFVRYVFGAEQFSRYARFWTRGYDTYTPTKNIVYHDYEPNPDGHGTKEWQKQRRERIKKESLLRIKTFLGINSPEGVAPDVAHANLGIYGLGKRRTLQQLQYFTGIDLTKRQGNKSKNCANKVWVSYDHKISPMDHMFEKATDLDPQPEFPMRTDFNFFVEAERETDKYLITNDDKAAAEAHDYAIPVANHPNTGGSSPPFMTLIILWMFGLVVWCMVFVNQGGPSRPRKRMVKKKGGAKDI